MVTTAFTLDGYRIVRNLGIVRYELQLNSIGDRACRPGYIEKLNAWLDDHADLLDDEARQKRATSPLRVFDVKNEKVREALDGHARCAGQASAGQID